MNTNAIYENTCKMLYAYDLANGAGGAKKVIENPFDFQNSRMFPFYAAAADILIECRAAFDKTTVSNGLKTAAKKVIKNAADKNPAFRGIFKSGEKYAVCDGYRFIRFSSDIESLQHIDENVKPLDLDKLTPDKYGMKTCNLPTAGELKQYITACKAKKKTLLYSKNISYKLENDYYVNPEYLYDIITALPDCVCYYKPENQTTPLYFIDENENDALLCPVSPRTAVTL